MFLFRTQVFLLILDYPVEPAIFFFFLRFENHSLKVLLYNEEVSQTKSSQTRLSIFLDEMSMKVQVQLVSLTEC